MITLVKAIGRIWILLSLTVIIAIAAVITEISIDHLTSQVRDLRHLLKHSLGNVGTMMALLSLAGYSIKKRWKTFPGRLNDYLVVHQWFAVTGGVLIAVHTGAHFNAAAPLATSFLMLTCLVSGFVGRYVYRKTQKEISTRKSEKLKAGISSTDAEEQLAFATATAKTLSNWRTFHRPVSLLLIIMLALHIVSALYFGG